MAQQKLSPVAQLQTIDFLKITQGETDEIGSMVQAATDNGFFYLDLRG